MASRCLRRTLWVDRVTGRRPGTGPRCLRHRSQSLHLAQHILVLPHGRPTVILTVTLIMSRLILQTERGLQRFAPSLAPLVTTDFHGFMATFTGMVVV